MKAPRLLTERAVQLRGSRLALALLRWGGWRLQFDGLPSRQGVLVVYPHTSNWDFVVGVLAKWAIGIPVAFWGKDSLFQVPLFGRWLRWLGGIPVRRHVREGAVEHMIGQMRGACAEDRFFWLALSPEGTRHASTGWRSGFYRVADLAEVPVGLVLLDYGRGPNPPWEPSRVLRDYLVRVERGSDEVLLGKAYLALGPVRVPTSYFVLERKRPTSWRGPAAPR